MILSTTAAIILQVVKLGIEGLELSQIDNEEGAIQKLKEIQSYTEAANKAWEDAAQPGDDEG